jgi:hypothetical protein
MHHLTLIKKIYVRQRIEAILRCNDLLGNSMLQNFQEKVSAIDEGIKELLSASCRKRADWFMRVESAVKDSD